ncbi:MAG TPA: cupin domain-containing protein [Acidimicrobiales bacterium]|nr:cupin domain-containing protein [Acidimicrobiales bacterium]
MIHRPALARCVGDAGTFLSAEWSRASHLHHEPRGFDDLLSLDHVDHLLTTAMPRIPAVRVVRDGTPVPAARYTRPGRLGGRPVLDLVDPGRLLEEFASGATIVLQGLHRYHPPLAGFCRQLELELTQPVQANAYLTPAGERGLGAHYDTHDVVVLQVAGRKQWTVYTPSRELPLPSQPWSASDQQLGPVILDRTLVPGDALYLPRGFPHRADAVDEPSLHLTIGITSPTWIDVVRDAFHELEDDDALRRSLPIGFASEPPEHLAPAVAEHLARAAKQLTAADAIALAERAVRRFWRGRPPTLSGQLRQLQRLPTLADGSCVRRRPGSVAHCAVHDGRLRVVLGDRSLEMRTELEPAVARLLSATDPVAVGCLADLLDAPSRLVLVRRLVREGIVEIVDG